MRGVGFVCLFPIRRLWFTGTEAQVCNGGIIQNVGDLFGTLCYCSLITSGWFFLHYFLTTFWLGLHLQWLSVLSLGSHFCQLLKCLVPVGAETGARRK